MKKLSTFAVLKVDGGDRVSFTYNELNEDGDIISTNNKKSFFAVDPVLSGYIEEIWKYIEDNKLK